MGETEKPMTKISGKVFKESGNPAGGITLRCDEKEVRTLFDGTYMLTDMQPGLYTITVHLNGYDENPVTVSVEENQETIQDITLTPAKGNSKIHGYVYEEETGEPAKTGGSVIIIMDTSNKIVSIDPLNGYYEFPNLTAGVYTIWSSILDYEDQKKIIDLAEDEEKEILFLVRKRQDLEVPWG